MDVKEINKYLRENVFSVIIHAANPVSELNFCWVKKEKQLPEDLSWPFLEYKPAKNNNHES